MNGRVKVKVSIGGKSPACFMLWKDLPGLTLTSLTPTVVGGGGMSQPRAASLTPRLTHTPHSLIPAHTFTHTPLSVSSQLTPSLTHLSQSHPSPHLHSHTSHSLITAHTFTHTPLTVSSQLTPSLTHLSQSHPSPHLHSHTFSLTIKRKY
ncbi:hypothetical protein Pmani_039283 [Petrolisthes manimaculis]|uniref:Uncharacterized protein n=1 Tax=Petrolisthes manimaculis TaxID=1843537 RepID=A0AAE1ND42_9EUCA|nr:hypothetical protein Pmani_039283 [Petrolisthes manimaculis]